MGSNCDLIHASEKGSCDDDIEEILDELLEGCERPEDLLGDTGLMKELKIKLMERMLGAELTEHLGYEDGEAAPPSQPNRRNGSSKKIVKGEDGVLPLAVPRDRPSRHLLRNCLPGNGW